jgi:hypothetical protein
MKTSTKSLLDSVLSQFWDTQGVRHGRPIPPGAGIEKTVTGWELDCVGESSVRVKDDPAGPLASEHRRIDG